jgi:hypothetical protein
MKGAFVNEACSNSFVEMFLSVTDITNLPNAATNIRPVFDGEFFKYIARKQQPSCGVNDTASAILSSWCIKLRSDAESNRVELILRGISRVEVVQEQLIIFKIVHRLF